MENELGSVFIVISFIGFAAMWVFVMKQLAWQSGWTDLAARYATTSPFSGKIKRWQNGYVGRTPHSRILTVGSADGGLYLHKSLLFRYGSDPLLIPWDAIEVTHERRFMQNLVVFSFADPPIGTARLSRRLAKWVSKHSEGQFVLPPDMSPE